ncbi:MAG: cytochrome P460 family protein [Alphaproteobacteria bacterium]
MNGKIRTVAGLMALVFASSALADDAVTYDAKGHLAFPAGYREWVFLSSGFDMSYVDTPTPMHMFDNVFVNPSAYRAFKETGTWPDKTIFVLEARGAQSKGSINKSGSYQNRETMGFEIHVRDSSRFKDNWAFFHFDKPEGAAIEMKHTAACYSCHQAHAAVDTTFTQFYPTLIGIAEDKKTLSANYLKEQAAPTPKP